MSKQKAILVSGYFNPIHKGHLEYFNNAKTILSIYTHRTVCATIKMIAEEFVEEFELCFANGGDQNNDTISERPVCEEMNVALIDGLGDKIQSSSWLLKKL